MLSLLRQVCETGCNSCLGMIGRDSYLQTQEALLNSHLSGQNFNQWAAMRDLSSHWLFIEHLVLQSRDQPLCCLTINKYINNLFLLCWNTFVLWTCIALWPVIVRISCVKTPFQLWKDKNWKFWWLIFTFYCHFVCNSKLLSRIFQNSNS